MLIIHQMIVPTLNFSQLVDYDICENSEIWPLKNSRTVQYITGIYLHSVAAVVEVEYHNLHWL